MTPYTIKKVPIAEILPLKSISEHNPGYKFVLEHTRNNKTALPVILSKNLMILDGHKSLKAISVVSQENSGHPPETIEVFILEKEMTEAEAWEMYYIYNKKHFSRDNLMDVYEAGTRNESVISPASADEISLNTITLQDLYRITNPIRAHLISAMFASKLSSISTHFHREFSEVFKKTLLMGLKQHGE